MADDELVRCGRPFAVSTSSSPTSRSSPRRKINVYSPYNVEAKTERRQRHVPKDMNQYYTGWVWSPETGPSSVAGEAPPKGGLAAPRGAGRWLERVEGSHRVSAHIGPDVYPRRQANRTPVTVPISDSAVMVPSPSHANFILPSASPPVVPHRSSSLKNAHVAVEQLPVS